MCPAPGSRTIRASGSASAMSRARCWGQSRSWSPTSTTTGIPRSAASEPRRRCSPIDARKAATLGGCAASACSATERTSSRRAWRPNTSARTPGASSDARTRGACSRERPTVPMRRDGARCPSRAVSGMRTCSPRATSRPRRPGSPRVSSSISSLAVATKATDDDPLGDQPGVPLGQGHEGHPAHGVPGEHQRALGHALGDQRGEVVGGASHRRGALGGRVGSAVPAVVVAQDAPGEPGAAQVVDHPVPGPQVLRPAVDEHERRAPGAVPARSPPRAAASRRAW